MCSATTKVRPGSCQPKNQGTRTRCAEELIGSNSVSPCTTPRITAFHSSIWAMIIGSRPPLLPPPEDLPPPECASARRLRIRRETRPDECDHRQREEGECVLDMPLVRRIG